MRYAALLALALCAAPVAAQPAAPHAHAPSSCQYVPESLAARTARAFREAERAATATERAATDRTLQTLRDAWTFHRASVVAEGWPRADAARIQNTCSSVRYEILLRRWLRGGDPRIPAAPPPESLRTMHDRVAVRSASAALRTVVSDCRSSPAAGLAADVPWIAAGPAPRAFADAVVTADRADEVAAWLRAPHPWSAVLPVDRAVFAADAGVPPVEESVFLLTATPDVVAVMRSARVRWARFEVVARRNAMGPHGGGVSWVECRNRSMAQGYDGLPDGWMFAGAVEELPVGAQVWGAWIESPGEGPQRWLFVPGTFLLEDATHDVGALLARVHGG